jgi:hypothetical protein
MPARLTIREARVRAKDRARGAIENIKDVIAMIREDLKARKQGIPQSPGILAQKRKMMSKPIVNCE